jgi:RNA polymerase sigma-70 factor (ECF subfamily)
MQAITAEPRTSIRTAVDPFERLFRREYARVVAIANRVLADPEEAEDVAQEVFADLHRLHRPEAHYAAAWLHRAAVHAALNSIRSRQRRARRETAYVRDNPAPDDPAETAVRNAERAMVRRALGRLPRRSAEVLALRYGGLSYAEVAGALGVGVNSVGTMLKRAEARLRREVERAASE